MERRGQLHGDKDQANRRRFKSKIRKGLRKETMLISNNRSHFYARQENVKEAVINFPSILF